MDNSADEEAILMPKTAFQTSSDAPDASPSPNSMSMSSTYSMSMWRNVRQSKLNGILRLCVPSYKHRHGQEGGLQQSKHDKF